MKLRRRHSILTGLVLLAGGAIWAAEGTARGQTPGAERPPVPVRTAPVQPTTLTPVAALPGHLVSERDSRLAAEVPGLIVAIAPVGTTLEAGGEVARIDDRDLRLATRIAEARVATLRAQHDFQTDEVHRLQTLAAAQSAPRSRLDEARLRLRTLAHELDLAEAELEQARLRLARAVIRAPFRGQVAAHFTDIGEHVAAGSPVLRLVSLETAVILVHVPTTAVPLLQEGMPIAFDVDGVRQDGTVQGIVRVSDPETDTAEVRIAASLGDLPLGYPVTVMAPDGPAASGLGVPVDAVLTRSGQSFVFVVAAGSVVQRVAVEVRNQQRGTALVAGRLSPGDRVVVRGAERLADGQKVKEPE